MKSIASQPIKIKSQKDFNLLVTKNTLPCIVIFISPWSGNSFLLTAMLEKLVVRFNGQFRLYSIDAEKFPQLKKHFFITETPTTCFFRRGVLKNKLKGILPSKNIEAHIFSLLAQAA